MDVLGYGLAGRTVAYLNTRISVLKFFMNNRYLHESLFWGSLLLLPLAIPIQLAEGLTTEISQEMGIQPLSDLQGHSPYTILPGSARPLLSAKEQETFLQELEGLPPNWNTLKHPDHTEQSERLFQLNRARDQARLAHANMIQQPIAFLWSGILRRYLPEYQGFSVALGPELTHTSWGIVRFKPMRLPDYLVAIPSPESARELLVQQQKGEQIDIGVLFIGTLVADESLIYGFSHDGKEEGMILPVVQIQDVRYFLKTP